MVEGVGGVGARPTTRLDGGSGPTLRRFVGVIPDAPPAYRGRVTTVLPAATPDGRGDAAAPARAPRPVPVPVELLAHLRRARDHLDREYRSPVDLAQVAAVAGVSKFHFARAFAATYGQTPMHYLTRRRIERAQDLLRGANLTVTEICMAVGYASLGSFSARFTELVGETPTAYRNRWAALGGPHVPGCYLFMSGVLDPTSTGLVQDRNPGEAAAERPRLASWP